MLGKTNSLLDSAPPRQITLTLEGAKEDTITVTDSSGNTIGSCVFASGQTTGDITIPITDGQSYTFTSSVAKDTTSGTSDYSKSVVLTSESTSVYVFPSKTETDKSNMVCWYGNKFNSTLKNGATLESNYVKLASTSSTFPGIYSASKNFEANSKFKVLRRKTSSSGTMEYGFCYPSTASYGNYWKTQTASNSQATWDSITVTNATETVQMYASAYGSATAYIYAMYVE